LICQRVPTKRLRLDHNHRTLKFRGLLCDTCNTAIGLLGENEEWFYRAIRYLNGELLPAAQEELPVRPSTSLDRIDEG
jgi:hypothetical protein